MVTSNYMPDVECHIAFDSGYNTPAASRTWTDVSAYVELAEGIDIDFGRQDERSTADANGLSLTLDNSDGRFTAGRSAGAYYPNVKIGRPIRVKVTPPSGSAVTRFVGFIDEWPVEWDGTDAYAKARIRATSRLARLGLSTRLRSMPEQAILKDRPAGYWTLGDPAGSTSAAEAGSGSSLVVSGGTVTFGNATGPGTDGLTAMESVEGQLQSEGPALSSGSRTLRCWVLVNTLPSVASTALLRAGGLGITVDTSGLVHGPTTTGPSINDGSGHDIALVWDGVDEILYVDGVEVASAASGAPAATSGVTSGPLSGSTSASLVMAHAAVYESALSAAEVAAQAEVMTASAAAERTDERLTRILGWAGVASTEVTTETGSETMTYQVTSGQSVVDALRDVESTEGGVLYDRADGNVGFHNRAHRYLKTASATLNMAAQHVEADYAPKLDRSTLVNDVTVENPTTSESARSVSTASSDEYGIATTSARSVADTYDPLQQKAAWLIASYAEPRNRVPSLTVDVLAHQGLTPSAQTLLGVTIGDLLAITNAPTQSDTTSPSYFVEGYGERIGPESYYITFNLSPTYPTLNTFVIGDATRGQLDSSYVLAL